MRSVLATGSAGYVGSTLVPIGGLEILDVPRACPNV